MRRPALTICQPFASLIALGLKRVENRTWNTPFRGPLLIHAGKSLEWMDANDVIEHPGMPLGAVVAEAVMVACFHISAIRDGTTPPEFDWLRDHKHTEGPWCHVYADVVKLPKPVAYKGAQGFFPVPWPPTPEMLAIPVPAAVLRKGKPAVGTSTSTPAVSTIDQQLLFQGSI